MDNIRSIRLRQLHGQLGAVVYELTRVQFSHSVPSGWNPAINAYRCKDCITVCIDLAGVQKEEIDLRIEPRRLLLRGDRKAPEPQDASFEPVQVLTMEIDYGPFEREILLPAEVDSERVTADVRDGFLWVYLPLRAQA